MSLSTTFVDRVRAGAAALSERLDADGAEVALILGSGLAAIASAFLEPGPGGQLGRRPRQPPLPGAEQLGGTRRSSSSLSREGAWESLRELCS